MRCGTIPTNRRIVPIALNMCIFEWKTKKTATNSNRRELKHIFFLFFSMKKFSQFFLLWLCRYSYRYSYERRYTVTVHTTVFFYEFSWMDRNSLDRRGDTCVCVCWCLDWVGRDQFRIYALDSLQNLIQFSWKTSNLWYFLFLSFFLLFAFHRHFVGARGPQCVPIIIKNDDNYKHYLILFFFVNFQLLFVREESERIFGYSPR